MCESHGDIKVQAFPACAAFPTPEFYCDREVTKAQVLREVLNSVALFLRRFRLPWPAHCFSRIYQVAETELF